VDGKHRHTSWSRKAGDIEDRSRKAGDIEDRSRKAGDIEDRNRRDADIKPGHPVELPHTAMFTGR
jgi:hypothetical protein